MAAEQDKEMVQMAEAIVKDVINPNYDLDQEFSILSTIRYDPMLAVLYGNPVDVASAAAFQQEQMNHYFLLGEHYKRLCLALAFFKWPYQLTFEEFLRKLVEATPNDTENVYKMRVLLNKTGKVTMEAHLVQTTLTSELLGGFSGTPTWKVKIDTEPVIISPFTSFKTTHRPMYTAARNRTNVGTECDEVLLFNTMGQLTEGSITNVAVQKDGKWVTPPLASGCLCGVTRHMLIAKGYVEEDTVSISSIKTGDEVLLFNGIMGVVRATVV